VLSSELLATKEDAMSQGGRFVIPTEQERVLVTELSETVLGQAAPEELVIFNETAEEFFGDPDRVLRTRSRDEPVGFGLEIALLTPYVLAVVGPVVKFLGSLLASSVQEGSKAFVGEWVRSLFKSKQTASPTAPASPAGLTPEQARQVHEIAYTRATLLGLPAATATLLADSVVGGLLIADEAISEQATSPAEGGFPAETS
jgi:hypothetical protein